MALVGTNVLGMKKIVLVPAILSFADRFFSTPCKNLSSPIPHITLPPKLAQQLKVKLALKPPVTNHQLLTDKHFPHDNYTHIYRLRPRPYHRRQTNNLPTGLAQSAIDNHSGYDHHIVNHVFHPTTGAKSLLTPSGQALIVPNRQKVWPTN